MSLAKELELECQRGGQGRPRQRYEYDFTADKQRYSGARLILHTLSGRRLIEAAFGLTLVGDYILSGKNGEREQFYDYAVEFYADLNPGDTYDLDTDRDRAVDLVRKIMKRAVHGFKIIITASRKQKSISSSSAPPLSSTGAVTSKQGVISNTAATPATSAIDAPATSETRATAALPPKGSYPRFLIDNAELPRSGGRLADDTSAYEDAFKGPWVPRPPTVQKPAVYATKRSAPNYPRKHLRNLPRGRPNPDLSMAGNTLSAYSFDSSAEINGSIATANDAMSTIKDMLIVSSDAASSSTVDVAAGNKRVGSDTITSPPKTKRAKNTASTTPLPQVDLDLSDVSSLTESDDENAGGNTSDIAAVCPSSAAQSTVAEDKDDEDDESVDEDSGEGSDADPNADSGEGSDADADVDEDSDEGVDPDSDSDADEGSDADAKEGSGNAKEGKDGSANEDDASPSSPSSNSDKDPEEDWEDSDSVGSEEMGRIADQAMFDLKKSRQGSILLAAFKASTDAKKEAARVADIEDWRRNLDHIEWTSSDARKDHGILQAKRKGWKVPKAQRQRKLFPGFGSRFVLSDDDIFHIDCGSGEYRFRAPRK